ncbi:uncharacterized protein LOC106641730 [Copidosoma floridanum]|uniref:uncharacterized protein LOC106641730 n=1 Tax=Copidosoma floridanum TaxID=29053 RepID=UPI0006C93DAB|nr:uncharacterized protein LOC106641730 [Copidosoma floridanum]
MVERLRRTLKVALRCCPQSWVDALPMVLLGLRSAYKEDLEASPAEMVFGTALRLPGQFFVTSSVQANHINFVHSLKQLFLSLRPVPASRHSNNHPFSYRDLRTCSHVFLRIDSIRRPLEPPYSGPHRVLERTGHRTFVIERAGAPKEVSVDQLKPAYLEAEARNGPADDYIAESPPLTSPTAAPQVETQATQPEPTPAAQKAWRHDSFPAVTKLVTGGEVDVATQPTRLAPSGRRKQQLIPRELY